MIHKTMKKTIDNELLATFAYAFARTLQNQNARADDFISYSSIPYFVNARSRLNVKPLNCFSTKITKHN